MSKIFNLLYHGVALVGRKTNAFQIISLLNGDSNYLYADADVSEEIGKVVYKNEENFKINLYVTSGNLYYDPTRFELVKKADGIVFVIDSQIERFESNLETFLLMKNWLSEFNKQTPYVIQYNKRDLPDVYPIMELEKKLNVENVESFEAIAKENIGVTETFEGIISKASSTQM